MRPSGPTRIGLGLGLTACPSSHFRLSSVLMEDPVEAPVEHGTIARGDLESKSPPAKNRLAETWAYLRVSSAPLSWHAFVTSRRNFFWSARRLSQNLSTRAWNLASLASASLAS